MTTAACQACQGAEITTAARGGAHRSSGSVPSDEKRLGSTKTEEVGECEQEKQGETWEKEDDEYDGPATDKLRKRNTEETLVSSPVRSGSFQREQGETAKRARRREGERDGVVHGTWEHDD
ncbi:hypothetical protein VTK73DRAFT_6450 [Phialemonium thermophilum]|uniref:Uncharacterized protein n=1 Tax=Phialemonium thermophilum TaxID=223376 RepID=A0ABR3V051_9PEZI